MGLDPNTILAIKQVVLLICCAVLLTGFIFYLLIARVLIETWLHSRDRDYWRNK